MSRLADFVMRGAELGISARSRELDRADRRRDQDLDRALQQLVLELDREKHTLRGSEHDLAASRHQLDLDRFDLQTRHEAEGRAALAALVQEMGFGMTGEEVYGPDPAAGPEVYGPPAGGAGDPEVYGPPVSGGLEDPEVYGPPAGGMGGGMVRGAMGGGVQGVIGNMPTALSRPIVGQMMQQQLVGQRLRASNMEKQARQLEGIEMLPIDEERKAVLRASVLGGLGMGTLLNAFPELATPDLDPAFFDSLNSGDPEATATFFDKTGRYVRPRQGREGLTPDVVEARTMEFDQLVAELPRGSVNEAMLPLLRRDYIARGRPSVTLWGQATRNDAQMQKWVLDKNLQTIQQRIAMLNTSRNAAIRAYDDEAAAALGGDIRALEMERTALLKQATTLGQTGGGNATGGAPGRTASPAAPAAPSSSAGGGDEYSSAWDAFMAKHKRAPDPDNPDDRKLFAELLNQR